MPFDLTSVKLTPSGRTGQRLLADTIGARGAGVAFPAIKSLAGNIKQARATSPVFSKQGRGQEPIP